MPLPKELIDQLLNTSDGEIATQVLVPGGIFSGALRVSDHEGVYEFMMAVPGPSGNAQFLKMHLSAEAIIGIGEPPEEITQPKIFTPGGGRH